MFAGHCVSNLAKQRLVKCIAPPFRMVQYCNVWAQIIVIQTKSDK